MPDRQAPDPGADAAPQNTRAELERLLDEMIEHPERQGEIIPVVETTFGQQRAVMVLDMSGFSKTTQKHGIVSFLLMIHQMKLVVQPALSARRGVLVKEEADNLFCLFDTVADAAGASLEITQRLGIVNLLLPEAKRLYVSIGIGYGHLLNIEDQDLFGDEVNVASKLGEDLAQRGEILLTEAAAAALGDETYRITPHTVSISGLSLTYHQLERR